jgi:hypothetical protein
MSIKDGLGSATGVKVLYPGYVANAVPCIPVEG